MVASRPERGCRPLAFIATTARTRRPPAGRRTPPAARVTGFREYPLLNAPTTGLQIAHITNYAGRSSPECLSQHSVITSSIKTKFSLQLICRRVTCCVEKSRRPRTPHRASTRCRPTGRTTHLTRHRCTRWDGNATRLQKRCFRLAECMAAQWALVTAK